MVVVDPTFHERLTDHQKQRLDQFLDEAGLTAIGSIDELEAAWRRAIPSCSTGWGTRDPSI